MKCRTKVMICQALMLLGLTVPGVLASEGGGSHYVQPDVLRRVFFERGSAGLYLRNDLAYLDGDIGPSTRGRYTLESYEQRVWVNTLKLIYIFDGELLSGRPGLALALPLVINVEASGRVIVPTEFSAALKF